MIIEKRYFIISTTIILNLEIYVEVIAKLARLLILVISKIDNLDFPKCNKNRLQKTKVYIIMKRLNSLINYNMHFFNINIINF